MSCREVRGEAVEKVPKKCKLLFEWPLAFLFIVKCRKAQNFMS